MRIRCGARDSCEHPGATRACIAWLACALSVAVGCGREASLAPPEDMTPPLPDAAAEGDVSVPRDNGTPGEMTPPDLGVPAEGDMNVPRDAGIDAPDIADGGFDPDGVSTLSGLAVAQGPCHGCAWYHGRVRCWGANTFGALGDSTTSSRGVAAPVVGLDGEEVVQVAVGCGNPVVTGHTCALTAKAEVCCRNQSAHSRVPCGSVSGAGESEIA